MHLESTDRKEDAAWFYIKRRDNEFTIKLFHEGQKHYVSRKWYQRVVGVKFELTHTGDASKYSLHHAELSTTDLNIDQWIHDYCFVKLSGSTFFMGNHSDGKTLALQYSNNRQGFKLERVAIEDYMLGDETDFKVLYNTHFN